MCRSYDVYSSCTDAANLCPRNSKSNPTISNQPTNGQNVMGIVWAVPVRPDRLGYALSVFAAKMKKVHPLLVVFRKSVQIGGNPCSMLPPELVNYVADIVVASEHEFPIPEEQMWLQGYLCSQNICKDCQHVTDDIIEEYADDFDKIFGIDNYDMGEPFPWDENSDWDECNQYGGRDEWEKRHKKAPKHNMKDEKHNDDDGDDDEDEDDDEDDDMDDDDDDNSDSEAEYTPAQQNFLDERACSIHLTERGGGTRVNDHDYKEQITEWILDRQRFSHVKRHDAILQSWLDLFNQRPGGHFARLDKVDTSSTSISYLCTNFGLCLDPERFLRAGSVHLCPATNRL